MAQTAVEWLYNNLKSHFEHDGDLLEVVQMSFEQAKQMEMEKCIQDYNAGYDDAQCNHINDAENYVNEQKYLNDKEITDYIIGPFGTPENK